MYKAFQIAFLCGAMPLGLGISIFLIWLFTMGYEASDSLMEGGILTILIGFVCSVVGIGALLVACILAIRNRDISRRKFWKYTLSCIGILFVNYPVAGVILYIASMIGEQFTVIVENDFAQPIENVRVFGARDEVLYGTLPPGASDLRTIRVRGESGLEFEAFSEDTRHALMIIGYVMSMDGGFYTVTVHPDGSVSDCKGGIWMLIEWSVVRLLRPIHD